MSYLIQPLFAPTQLANAAGVLFTATARTQIQALTVANPAAANHTATLYWVPSGGTASAANQLPATVVLAGQSWIVSELIGQTLATGDALWGYADTAAVVNIFGSGLVMS